MVRVFPNPATQPNEMMLTIYKSISYNFFSADERLETEKLANGKDISVFPFQTGKGNYLWY